MKVDPSRILVDHFATLRDAHTGRRSLADVMLFWGLPICAGALSFEGKLSVSPEIYNVSITFYGIFIALLLNMQVAVFGIFLRKWEQPKDTILAGMNLIKLDERKALLGEINANISYLILVSCFALVWFLALFAGSCTKHAWPALSVAIYAHFVLTLLMVVKRSHSLFQKEYEV
jgi:hypothetical protein